MGRIPAEVRFLGYGLTELTQRGAQRAQRCADHCRGGTCCGVLESLVECYSPVGDCRRRLISLDRESGGTRTRGAFRGSG